MKQSMPKKIQNRNLHSMYSTCRNPTFKIKTQASFDYVDQQFIDIIEQLYPSGISKHFGKKSMKMNQRNLTEPIFDENNVQIYQKIFFKERRKTMDQIQRHQKIKIKVKKQFFPKKRPISPFFKIQRNSVKNLQKKFYNKMINFGIHHEKMHPLCQIYQKQMLKVYENRKRQFHPFGNIQPVHQ